MAITDYFKDCNRIITTREEDNLGGITISDKVDQNTFKGLVILKSTQEQFIGALQGSNYKYNFFTGANENVGDGSKIRFTREDGSYLYVILRSKPILNPTLSGQTYWKSFPAEEYIPVNLQS